MNSSKPNKVNYYDKNKISKTEVHMNNSMNKKYYNYNILNRRHYFKTTFIKLLPGKRCS